MFPNTHSHTPQHGHSGILKGINMQIQPTTNTQTCFHTDKSGQLTLEMCAITDTIYLIRTLISSSTGNIFLSLSDYFCIFEVEQGKLIGGVDLSR